MDRLAKMLKDYVAQNLQSLGTHRLLQTSFIGSLWRTTESTMIKPANNMLPCGSRLSYQWGNTVKFYIRYEACA